MAKLGVAFAVGCFMAWAGATTAAELSFDDRVRAQEAIERVYYAHQIGATRPFEAAVPRAVIEQKVRTYLAQSAALDELWSTPVTTEALDAELRRIVSATRAPDRLHELFDALGNDPLLVRECLARPTLVDRLARGFAASDASATWSRFEGRRVPVVASGDAVPAIAGDTAATASCPPDDVWDNKSLAHLPTFRTDHTAVWTGTLMIVWGGWFSNFEYGDGSRYDPATDTWTMLSAINAPQARHNHAAVWTGSQMIVWGGRTGSNVLSTGGRYDPISDTWTPISTTNAPAAREEPTGVWTGTQMIVWGGFLTNGLGVNSGGRYDPATNTWLPTTTTQAPAARGSHTAIWTGTRMVVWGGANGTLGTALNSGGSYNPGADAWVPTTTLGAPAARREHTAVWTGGRMIVWGGRDAAALNTGGIYYPSVDAWSPVDTTNAPTARANHAAIWTGSAMLVWGGGFGTEATNTGGRFELATNTWTPLSTTGAPEARLTPTAIWTGSRMVVWGGKSATGSMLAMNTGARYDPASDSWTPTRIDPPLGKRYGHSAVWTGNHMIIWGGNYAGQPLNTGDRYDPALDVVTPITTVGAPQARWSHAAVWTGSLMLVWGGNVFGDFPSTNTGGRYDPLTDSWTPTSMTGTPFRTGEPSSVWTGSSMIVWNAGNQLGGRYDPGTDSWLSVSNAGSPSSRSGETAVWTGIEMIIWGGALGNSGLTTGARYNPTTDTWLPTGGTPPARRTNHVAVWTGSRMIVWGGSDPNIPPQPPPNPPYTPATGGGLYDPTTDSWTPISLTSAPVNAPNATAVWTGSLFIVQGPFGRFDPYRNEWRFASSANAPVVREWASSVWTGSRMIVWGGSGTSDDGGMYVASYVDADHDGFPACTVDCDDANPAVHPTAAELCNAIDDDCDGAVDETFDGDQDGVTTCAGDCNDADPGLWGKPGETRSLLVSKFDTTATGTWTAPANTGTSACCGWPLFSYDALAASSPSGFGASSCVAARVNGPAFEDAAVPGLGEGRYYLTRAQNPCGYGSLGNASDGTPRTAPACP